MSFVSLKRKKNKITDKKLPPHSAWGHYNKKQGSTAHVTDAPLSRGERLIEVKDVALSYEGKCVISGLNFDVCRGDYLCIIGENGSGKSTLLSALLGLKRVAGGSIEFTSLSQRMIGYLPQQNDAQKDFPATVEEIVLTGCLGRSSRGPFMTGVAKQVAFESMEKLGITSLAKTPYSTLSGGQKQRVMLARALCAAEKMLVLDEPVTALDPKTTADIYSLVDDLNKKQQMTVVMVTHDVPSALRYSTRILRINKNSVFFGPTEEYKKLPEARQFTENAAKKEDDVPFGEGGFRYRGDST